MQIHLDFLGRDRWTNNEQKGCKMPIDINIATAEEIDAIPDLKGHGFEIVRYREERGKFTALRQLDEVPGMVGKADGLGALLHFDTHG